MQRHLTDDFRHTENKQSPLPVPSVPRNSTVLQRHSRDIRSIHLHNKTRHSVLTLIHTSYTLLGNKLVLMTSRNKLQAGLLIIINILRSLQANLRICAFPYRRHSVKTPVFCSPSRNHEMHWIHVEQWYSKASILIHEQSRPTHPAAPPPALKKGPHNEQRTSLV